MASPRSRPSRPEPSTFARRQPFQAYISGALTHVAQADNVRSFYEDLAHACELEGGVPYLPHLSADPQAHPGLSPENVYARDVAAVLESDLMIAYIGLPSLGVGAEIAMAAAARIPLIGVRRPGDVVSRFITGLLRTVDAQEVTTAGGETAVVVRSAVRAALGTQKPH
jgi:nucleoside 2-deoxyribosyltransferase